MVFDGALVRGGQGRFAQSDFDADRLDARVEQRLVADDRVVLGGLVGPAERLEDLEPGKVLRNVADDRLQPVRLFDCAPCGSRSVESRC